MMITAPPSAQPYKDCLNVWLQQKIAEDQRGSAVIAMLETALQLAITDIGEDDTARIMRSVFARVAAHTDIQH